MENYLEEKGIRKILIELDFCFSYFDGKMRLKFIFIKIICCWISKKIVNIFQNKLKNKISEDKVSIQSVLFFKGSKH